MNRSAWVHLVLASLASGQTWVSLGPAPISNAGDTGRVAAVACHPTNPERYYIGAADGGVWRTDDGGTTWTPLTDSMPTQSIGALAIDPADPDTIYAGTGEANFAQHSRYGLGIYKSTDAGGSWAHLGEPVFGGRCISRLIVHPTNPQLVYAAVTTAGGFPARAAAKGHPGAAGPLGVFRSTDGGHTWSLLPGLPNLSITDLAISPGSPDVLYAGVGHIFDSLNADNGVYKSVDAGQTWSRLGGGLPTAHVGRIAIAVAPSNPARLYALIATGAQPTGDEAPTLGVYRSDDAGGSWVALSVANFQATYGWYLCTASVQPTNPDTLILGGLQLLRTTNAGASFSTITPAHVDMHAIAWDASGRLVVGDDGGVHRSATLGATWESRNVGLAIVQFYPGVSTHPTDDLRVAAGAQDNGTNLRSTDSLVWTRFTGGDGGWTQWDQQQPNRIFTELQGTGSIYLSTNGGGSVAGAGTGIDRTDRNCFLPPFLIDPSDRSRMYYATHRVYRATAAGPPWSAISDDLTGGEGAIRALAISTAEPSTLYAATNNGRFLVSSDGGSNWSATLTDVAGWPRLTREIWPDPSEPATVYLAGATFGAPHVRRSRDRGGSWEVLDGDLPDISVNVIATDARCTPPAIYAGTDAGVYRSLDDGRHWRLFGDSMPLATVIDLKPEPARGRMLASTMGRGVWAIPMVMPWACPPACDGDYNMDGNADQDDVAYLVSVIAGGPNPSGRDPDFTGDGNVDQDDYAALVNVIAGGACP